MNHLGLFEGIGGFSLAGRWAGWQTPVMVEWNPYCQAVLKKNFPNATIYGDIRQFDGRPFAGQIDIITGGFPCQPYSSAGKRLGSNDDRALWPEMLRVIREVGPEWVVGENVAGLITMDGGRVFAEILTDLENAGYSTEVFIIPALAVGSPHRRDRVWIVAHSEGQRFGKAWQYSGQQTQWATGGDRASFAYPQSAEQERPSAARPRRDGSTDYNIATTYACGAGLSRGEQCGTFGQRSGASRPTTECHCNGGQWHEHWHEVAARICRVDDGFPSGLDGVGAVPAKAKKGKAHRLEALGNAIVPQVAYQIFQAINNYSA